MRPNSKRIHFVHGIVYAFAFACLAFFLRFVYLRATVDYGDASSGINAFAGIEAFIFLLTAPAKVLMYFIVIWPCFELCRLLYNKKAHIEQNPEPNEDSDLSSDHEVIEHEDSNRPAEAVD